MEKEEEAEFNKWIKSRKIAKTLQEQDSILEKLMSMILTGKEIKPLFRSNEIAQLIRSKDFKDLQDWEKINKLNRVLRPINNELTNTKVELTDVKIDKEDLQDELKRNKTASQKYTEEDFEQYIKLYSESGFRWKVAFAELQKITLNEHIKQATSYNSFHTAFTKKHPEHKKR